MCCFILEKLRTCADSSLPTKHTIHSTLCGGMHCGGPKLLVPGEILPVTCVVVCCGSAFHSSILLGKLWLHYPCWAVRFLTQYSWMPFWLFTLGQERCDGIFMLWFMRGWPSGGLTCELAPCYQHSLVSFIERMWEGGGLTEHNG